MRAVGLLRHLPIADPESLIDVEVPDPRPSQRDLLVRVKAVSVNPVDTKWRQRDTGSEQTPRILGFDAAGIVEATGPDVTLFRKGDEVWYAGDSMRPGCDSELHLVDERIAARKPRSLDFAQAAGLPLTTLTVWEAFFDRMHIDPGGAHKGKSLLILGGAGGIGSIGIQIAKLAGLTVIATASRKESVEWCLSLGADHVIDHSRPLREEIERAGLIGVDYILNASDTIRYWDTCADLINPEGMICGIVGSAGATVNITLLMPKSAAFVWEYMFTRSRFGTAAMVEQHKILTRVADLIDAGRLRTTVTEVLRPINAANLRAAHARLEEGRMIGKIVVEGWEGQKQ